MAINTASGFQVGSSDAIDSRLVLTKNEMLTINENVYPQVYMCVCKDDGLLYVFSKSNAVDGQTGKFRVVTGDGYITEDVMNDILQEYAKLTDIPEAYDDSALVEAIGNIETALEGKADLSDIPDVSNFATIEYVDDAVVIEFETTNIDFTTEY